LHPLDIMNGPKNSNAWKSNRSSGVLVEPQQLQQQQQQQQTNKIPYIPQPDYTPLPTRRVDGLLTAVQQAKSKNKPVGRSSSSVVVVASSSSAGPTIESCSNTIPRIAEEKRIKTTAAPISRSMTSIEQTSSPESSPPEEQQRVWHHPQWHSSQFLANDWSAALMKRLSVEAQSHREEKILREANKELERFESEIESYLEDVEEEEEEEEKLPSELVNQENVVGDNSISSPSNTAMPISSSPQRVHKKSSTSSSSQSDSSSERKNELGRRNQTLTIT
jgi:hypothetical protein